MSHSHVQAPHGPQPLPGVDAIIAVGPVGAASAIGHWWELCSREGLFRGQRAIRPGHPRTGLGDTLSA